jgi:UDP-N-acetylmuramyl pentapeptide phosphotransferase/UDP-N-acetylglucosamine-1-phosphate transferase
MANPRALRCKKFALLGLAIAVAFAAGYPFLPTSLQWFALGVFAGFYLTLLAGYIDLFWEMSKERKKALTNGATYLGALFGAVLVVSFNLLPANLVWFPFGIVAGIFLCLAAIVSNLFWEKPKE